MFLLFNKNLNVLKKIEWSNHNFFVVLLCIFSFFKNSIKCILLLCITINQVRTLINVISQNGFRLWGLCQVLILSTAWENFPVCSTGWEHAGSLNLLCGFVTRPLAGPIPCSPAPLAFSSPCWALAHRAAFPHVAADTWLPGDCETCLLNVFHIKLWIMHFPRCPALSVRVDN